MSPRRRGPLCAYCGEQSRGYPRFRQCQRCGDQYCVVCDLMEPVGRPQDARHSCGMLLGDSEKEMALRSDFWSSRKSSL